MIRFLLLLLALVTGGPATAQTARVISGEHDRFTRLVIELPRPGPWRVGRSGLGYGFAAEDSAQPDYDLTTVWQRIPRTRLQALRVDRTSGALLLTLACDCHVLPFEYRPGTIVLDIREGPAPSGSAFEAPFAIPTARTAGPPVIGGGPAAYDWRSLPSKPRSGGPELPPVAPEFSLAPLRDALLRQISRGAVDGVVEMQLPGKPLLPDFPDDAQDPAWARIRIGPLPGVEASLPGATEPVPDAACLADNALSLAEWGAGRDPLDLLSEARSGLYGEFDEIQPEAVLRTVQMHLYLGFGAEALQYAALLPTEEQPVTLKPLLSIARIIDGQASPDTDLAGMLACDGAAALWAALSHESLPMAAAMNTDAILRAFLALPPHLRRHLGPRLASLLLPREPEAARMVRDAMARTPDVPASTVALADAEAGLLAGQAEVARAAAEASLAEAPPGPEALIALVEAHFQLLKPLPEEQALALLAQMRESGPQDRRLVRAAALALALSAQWAEAFDLAGASGPEQADLWQLAVDLADDDAFLSAAVPEAVGGPKVLAPDLERRVAKRLFDLGFPDAALTWLGPVSLTSPPEDRLIAAAAALATDNAEQALALLDGLSSIEALDLRRRALVATGALAAAQVAASAAGQDAEAARLAAWRADWTALAKGEPSAWTDAAARVLPEAPVDDGPLGRGAALLETSAAVRAAVSALLAEVPVPEP
jgi:hypothetical protein